MIGSCPYSRRPGGNAQAWTRSTAESLWQLAACDTAFLYAIAARVPRATTAFPRQHLVHSDRRAGHRVRAVLAGGRSEICCRFLRVRRELNIEHLVTEPHDVLINGPVGSLQVGLLANSEACRSDGDLT